MQTLKLNGKKYRIFKIAGKVYHVPETEVEKLNKYIKEVWTPNIKGTPANLRSLSFSIFLAEYVEENFKQYEV